MWEHPNTMHVTTCYLLKTANASSEPKELILKAERSSIKQ